jgi:hypothetical protein
MKNILKFGIVMLSIAFVNCSKSSSDDATAPPVEDSSPQSVKATVDGQAWEATKITSTIIRYASQGQQRFDINAEDAAQKITISCSGPLSANSTVDIKTYSFGSANTQGGDALFTNAYIVGSGSFGFHIPKSGTLTITSVNANNKTISGTFSFSSERQASPAVTSPPSPLIFNATNGVFKNVKYTLYSI